MEVKREVIVVDEGHDDPGVASVGATLWDPYAEYQAEPTDDEPEGGQVRQWNMPIGGGRVEGPNVVTSNFRDAYSVHDIQSGYAQEEGRRPWRKRYAADPAEPCDEEPPSKMSKQPFLPEFVAPEHLWGWQSSIKHDLVDASDKSSEEYRWHSQSRTKGEVRHS